MTLIFQGLNKTINIQEWDVVDSFTNIFIDKQDYTLETLTALLDSSTPEGWTIDTKAQDGQYSMTFTPEFYEVHSIKENSNNFEISFSYIGNQLEKRVEAEQAKVDYIATMLDIEFE